MSLPARRELAIVMAKEYHMADRKHRSQLLKEFCALTGYHPKYAVVVLKQAYFEPEKLSPGRKLRPRKRRRKYDELVRVALITLWRLSGYQCSKLLVEFTRKNLYHLIKEGSLAIDRETEAKLMKLCPATADRLLADERFRRKGRSKDMSSSSPLIKSLVSLAKLYTRPPEPGHLQVDLVIHCGDNPRGHYVCTVSATDIFTGWSAAWACLGKSQQAVFEALEKVFSSFPFPIKSFQTDNGSEFLNAHLISWAEKTGIRFLRSEEYRKDENGYVEERNGHSIRKFVGYRRLESSEDRDILNKAYGALNLLTNLFWTRMKCIGKVRVGSRVRRYFDKPLLPLERVIPFLSEDKARELMEMRDSLRMAELMDTLEANLNRLYKVKHAPEHNEALSCAR